MSARLNPFKVKPEGFKALLAVEAVAAGPGLEQGLVLLVKTRASQINGCAYCVNMHTRDALKAGESAQRLFLLNAWDDSGLFTPREQAALALTEAMTHVAETRVPDAVYDQARAHFDEAETAQLILLIAMINAWNRIQVASRAALD